MLGRGLKEALDHEFFRWFHLARYEPPRALADGATWHGFRPAGEKFSALVTVNLETDAAAHVADATLCLDRAFVEDRSEGAFARDLAASFLRWAVPPDEQPLLADLLAELGDLGPNVIRLGDVPAMALPSEPTPLYRTYLGRLKEAELALPGKVLRLVNLQARDGPRDPRHDWIWIRVATAG